MKLHLQDLTADDRLGLLSKITHGNGVANSYHIRHGFAGLKKLHNFLNAHGAVPALMKTRYFKEYTASPAFMLMVRMNILANSILDLSSYIMDDDRFAKLKSWLQGVTEADREEIVEWMERIRARDRDDESANAFFSMMDQVRSVDIDKLFQTGCGVMTANGITDVEAVSAIFEKFMSQLIIPESRRETVSTILRLSPGAFDYMLNSKSDNPLFPPNIFLVYYCSQLLQLSTETMEANFKPGAGRAAVRFSAETLELQFEPVKRATIDFPTYIKYTSLLPCYTPEPPIVLITRSLFVSDMVHGRLAVDEIPEETLRLVFSS
ncbi:MAG TPA: hypothetical protein VK436_00010 [Methanocella sp.]|nr:hypothetical protein [Methanocella sp.]